MFVPTDIGHLPGEISQKYHVNSREKTMPNHKTKITRAEKPRKIVGYVGSTGNLLLKLCGFGTVNHCVVNLPSGKVDLGSYEPIEYLSPKYTEAETIYEGDSVTIQF
jgi:hypothetical protein